MKEASNLPTELTPGDTPENKRKRRSELEALVSAVLTAEFPRDYKRFERFAEAMRLETTIGKRVQTRWACYAAQANPNQITCPNKILLPLLQADLALSVVRHWETLTSGVPSPKRKLAEKEPVPAKAAALDKEADREEEAALNRIRDELTGKAAFNRFCESLARLRKMESKPTAEQRRLIAQSKLDRTPAIPKVCIWSKPMSQVEYKTATGASRKTIQRFLAKIKAQPSVGRRHAADPGRYNVAVNLNILAHWIEFWIPDLEHARGLAAATIAYSEANDPAFSEQISRTLIGVLKRRGLLDDRFAAALTESRKHDSPRPTDYTFWSGMMASRYST